MRYIYTFLLYCLVPFVLLRLFLLGFRMPGYRSGWGERFGLLPCTDFSRPVFWVHAVSVGEVEASVALLRRLIKLFPQYQFVITTVTPAGAQTVQMRFAGEVVHFYLPYDLPFAVQRFLRLMQPVICVIMETELWPNLYHYCDRQKIPLVLANARISIRSLHGYRKFRGLISKMLACVTRIVAQSKLDADRFIAIGCDAGKVSIAGNLKFDIEMPAAVDEQAGAIRQEYFPQRPVWIAASTHEGEEELVLDAHKRILKGCKDCLLIIAPRHPHRVDRIAALCGKKGFSLVRKSEDVKINDSTEIFLLDTLGELQLYYACADLAFVGGSMVPAGGHNMLEPASLGVPIIAGKHVGNFRDISRLLQEAGALCLVEDTAALAGKVAEILHDANLRQQMGDKGIQLVARNRGSVDQLVNVIKTILG